LVTWEGTTRNAVPSTSALPFPIVYHSTENPQLRELFHNMYENWRKKELGYEWKAKFLMFSIIDAVGTLLKNDNNQMHDQTHLVLKAIEYMKNHYQSPINRNMLAEYVSLSPSYFSTLFKNQTGYTPMQYLTKLRMDKAKQLLRTTNLPIAEIGKCVGFTDNFYFSKVFTKETGLSPKRYKCI
jgi:YesN/AraC family two-component response regulator